MLDELFNSVFENASSEEITLRSFLVCLGASVLIGLILAVAYMYNNSYSKTFVVTLAIIPAVVSMIIMMVNNKIGASVAVAGAFSLVRFRSMPGNAREIGGIFVAMSVGLVSGMGYISYSFIFTAIMVFVSIIYTKSGFGDKRNRFASKALSITIPEDLNYSEIFADLLKEYTTSAELVKVKTTNLGSMFRLTFNIILKDDKKEKEFIDKLRCRNGNLEIVISKQDNESCEL